MRYPKLISLDAAGTLIRPIEPVGKTYARFAKKWGQSVTPDALDAAFRKTFASAPPAASVPGQPSSDNDRSWWRGIVWDVFRHCDCDFDAPSGGEDFEALFGALFDHFAEPEVWELFPETVEALDRMAEGARLWLLSNSDGRLHGVIDDLGIDGYFQGRMVSSEVGYAKPEREIFEAMLEKSGERAIDCAHIGDDALRDGEGAKKAGIAGFLVDRPETDLLGICDKLKEVGFSHLRNPD